MYINPAGGKVMVVGVNGRKVEKGIHVVNISLASLSLVLFFFPIYPSKYLSSSYRNIYVEQCCNSVT